MKIKLSPARELDFEGCKGSKNRPSWLQERPSWPQERSSWPQVRPSWPQERPSWPQVRPSWPQVRPSWPKCVQCVGNRAGAKRKLHRINAQQLCIPLSMGLVLLYLSIDLLLVALILGGLFLDCLVPPSGAVREGNASPTWHLRELEASRIGSAEGFWPPS